jgi:predicted DNA-binding ribbon-helix-helix protein
MKKTSLYLDEKLFPKIKALAKKNRQSVSALLNTLMEQAVKDAKEAHLKA